MICAKRNAVLAGLCAGLLGAGCGEAPGAGTEAGRAALTADRNTNQEGAAMNDKVVRTDAEWKQELTPEQYRVLRQKDTERAFTGAYWNLHDPGVYRCAGCGQVLFAADQKFDSGCGWPSFSAPAATNRIEARTDESHFMHRTEVLCSRCGGHLGHVFEDGPKPTGMRYCINSASLKFEHKPETETERPTAAPVKPSL
jgi:peptide-methionine (R)-S-oxide reductase